MRKSEDSKSGETNDSKIVSLSDKDLRDAARLFQLLAGAAVASGAGPDVIASASGNRHRASLVARARTELDGRRLRQRFFNAIMFGEPAWDVLLMLYICEQSFGRLTMSRLAEWVEAPLTTVGRWVKYLEDEQLAQRESHPTDRRTVFISLRDKGRTALDSYLSRV